MKRLPLTHWFLLAVTPLLPFQAAAQTRHPQQRHETHRGVPAKAVAIGQFYDYADKAKAPWEAFRICGVAPNKGFRLSLRSPLAKSFALPFASANLGPGWQRLNREKSGCDVILIRVGSRRGAGRCSWVMTQGGKVISRGQITIAAKVGHPFTPAAGRVRQGRAKR